jgi:hypothetical protein
MRDAVTNGKRISTIDLLMLALAVNIVTAGAIPAAHASAFTTSEYVTWQVYEQRVDRVAAWLGEERVQAQLVRLGVDPEEAQARVAALTADELAALEARIDEMPAGGDTLAILGIVFLVLIVLELLNVTNLIGR